MTEPEAETVVAMLQRCENPPVVVMETMDHPPAVTEEDKPTAEPEDAVYGSSEEAAAAEEERVQGSKGGRQEFSGGISPECPGRGQGWGGV